ncbi:MAG: hypothetical protein J6V10_08330, partial [Clostridia bacterium]|nr:hypothetical protein [Clostridia bacterium]
QVICSMGINPACMLFSEHIDSLAGAGIILSVVWEHSDIIAIDMLGDEFLSTVKTGDTVEVLEDGTVRIVYPPVAVLYLNKIRKRRGQPV